MNILAFKTFSFRRCSLFGFSVLKPKNHKHFGEIELAKAAASQPSSSVLQLKGIGSILLIISQKSNINHNSCVSYDSFRKSTCQNNLSKINYFPGLRYCGQFCRKRYIPIELYLRLAVLWHHSHYRRRRSTTHVVWYKCMLYSDHCWSLRLYERWQRKDDSFQMSITACWLTLFRTLSFCLSY